MESIGAKKSVRTILGAMLLSGAAFAQAQSIDSKGSDFWLGFPKNYNGEEASFSFFLSSEEAASITINAPHLTFTQQVDLEPGVAIKFDLPSNVETLNYDAADGTGIHLTSEQEFTVYGLSRKKFTTDAYLGLPVDVLGTEYITLGYSGSLHGESQFLVVATEDNTTVQIDASPLDNCPGAGEVVLNAGQTYMHRSCREGDISGTVISSSAPVSVFSGHECANIPDNDTTFCDHIIEQMPATSTWGRQFLIAPLAQRQNGDTFRFLASSDDTQIMINGLAVATLNKGEFFQTILAEASFVEASQPILTAQYSNGTSHDDVISDPFIMLIPPYEQFLQQYTFAAPTSGFRTNYANIITKTSNIEALQFDGVSIPNEQFAPIGTTDYSFAQYPVTPGSHTLEGAVAGVFVYGYDDDDSYGYPGGLSLSAVAEVESIQLKEGFTLKSDQACFEATVSDIQNAGVEDIRVDFLVELIEGFDRTDAEGVAEFCVEHQAEKNQYRVTVAVGEITTEQDVVQPPETSKPTSKKKKKKGGAIAANPFSLFMLGCLFVGVLRRRLRHN